ncbi:MAG: hypothetical protein KatS3mg044_1423 [Rhodothermaceae bacterium]|nr:MAG: hypothetical protein D6746_11815 [Bacteroidota bacterium]GIV62557.1 MAG: hypothetical protein KatS3mg044_1423 [Rhodothermaceae bacterium]
MTLYEHTPSHDEILDFIDDSIRQLSEAGHEACFILLGPDAYETFRHALAERLGREPRRFETYNYLPVVLDPFRGHAVCVVPGARAQAEGVQAYRLS